MGSKGCFGVTFVRRLLVWVFAGRPNAEWRRVKRQAEKLQRQKHVSGLQHLGCNLLALLILNLPPFSALLALGHSHQLQP